MATPRYGATLLFIVFAFGASWLLALPLWQGRGLADRLFLPLAVLIMWTPALAAALTSRLTAPAVPLRTALGLGAFRPARRTLRWGAGAIGAAILLSGAALLVGQAAGLYRFDLRHFSAFEQALRTNPAVTPAKLAQLPPIPLLVAAQLLVLVPASVFNALAAAGEEIGWRGWLLPRLLPLGTFPAILVSGVIWGLWHAPLILLGYNYGAAPGWLALACMCAMCTVIGALLAWLRMRSGSIWPGTFAHGAVNASGGLYLLLGDAGAPADTTQVTLLGWTGWILPALLAWALFHFKGEPHGQAAQL